MAIAPILVYLDEEIERMKANLKRAESRMNENPPFLIVKRNFEGNIYYYKKFWDKNQKKLISQYIGKDDINIEELEIQKKQIKAEYERRKAANMHRRKVLPLLEKQLKIAQKAYEIAGDEIL